MVYAYSMTSPVKILATPLPDNTVPASGWSAMLMYDGVVQHVCTVDGMEYPNSEGGYQAISTVKQGVVLIDKETGTILDGEKVVAVPGDVYQENEAGLDGASDSIIAGFGERYGFPLYVFVMDGE